MNLSFFPWPGRVIWTRAFVLFGILSLFLSHVDAGTIPVSPDGLCGSVHGNQSCIVGECCSAAGICGSTLDFCGAGCQPEHGGCNHALTLSSSAAPKASNTTLRNVGYYQVGQAYSRSCQSVSPEQINTANLTHLILAFVHFDASTYKIVSVNDHDVPYYHRFTALQKPNLQTWIGVGGGSFSTDLWRKMISQPANRKAFITSLVAFMNKYRFQGVDLDYEFPDAHSSDPDNLLALVHEMHAAFGSTYGISLALPNDKETMHGFRVEKMSSSVTFFNYMAYDMGGWGVNSGALQKDVRFQSDVRTIQPDLSVLWKRMPDRRKINLAIPYYGRGYTLSSDECLHCGCNATGPSSPGPCTDDKEGILSLAEIRDVIGAKNASVFLNGDAMQKRAIWGAGGDTQWMGFDDAETVALKLQWANAHGLGGVAFWSIDLHGPV